MTFHAEPVWCAGQHELRSIHSCELGVIKQKTVYIERPGKSGKKMKAVGYTLNKKFPELHALQTFLFETAPLDSKNVLSHLRKAGTIDFVGISGVFVRDFERRVDLLLAMKEVFSTKN